MAIPYILCVSDMVERRALLLLSPCVREDRLFPRRDGDPPLTDGADPPDAEDVAPHIERRLPRARTRRPPSPVARHQSPSWSVSSLSSAVRAGDRNRGSFWIVAPNPSRRCFHRARSRTACRSSFVNAIRRAFCHRAMITS